LRKDPYEVLGVPAGADEETVKRAFRALVREHHPDVSEAPDAERRFHELVDAYRRLTVPRRRFAPRRDQGLDLSGIVSFYSWLASKRARERAGAEPVALELELTFGEAIRGGRYAVEAGGRSLTVDVPVGTEQGDVLTVVDEGGGMPVQVVVSLRRRRGTGRIVQAVAVLGIVYALGLLVLVLVR
jgi:DnaJ-class molecular chaperone